MEFQPVVFNVAGQKYAVDISLVRGIEKVQNIVPVPNANKDIKGIINLRGDVIPIYSLRHHFHLEEVQHTDETKFIVVNTKGILLALEVDNVEEIHNVTDEMVYPFPTIVKTSDTGYFNYVICINGNLVLQIDIDELLSEEQADEIKKMVDKM